MGLIPVSCDIECHHGEDPNDENIYETAENQCDKFLVSFWKPVKSHQVEKYPSNSASCRDDEQREQHPKLKTFRICNHKKDEQ